MEAASPLAGKTGPTWGCRAPLKRTLPAGGAPLTYAPTHAPTHRRGRARARRRGRARRPRPAAIFAAGCCSQSSAGPRPAGAWTAAGAAGAWMRVGEEGPSPASPPLRPRQAGLPSGSPPGAALSPPPGTLPARALPLGPLPRGPCPGAPPRAPARRAALRPGLLPDGISREDVQFRRGFQNEAQGVPRRREQEGERGPRQPGRRRSGQAGGGLAEAAGPPPSAARTGRPRGLAPGLGGRRRRPRGPSHRARRPGGCGGAGGPPFECG